MESIWFLLIGLAAGWLIGLVDERWFSRWVVDLIVGVTGALIAGFVLGLAGVRVGGLVERSFLATAGAVILVFSWTRIRALVTRIRALMTQRPGTTPPQESAIRVCDGIVRKKQDSKLATILQLSDLHLLAKTRLTGDSHGSFLPDLERALEAQNEKFDLVVVTGDLIDASEWWPGRWTQAYAGALQAILKVCELVNVDPEQGLLIIPGNHDVRWRGNYGLPMLEQAFCDKCGPYFAHSYYPGLGLLVACFDSNEQVRPMFLDFAKGMASTKQCDTLMKGLRELPAPHREGAARAFRVALIHHHLMAIPSDDRRQTARSSGHRQ